MKKITIALLGVLSIVASGETLKVDNYQNNCKGPSFFLTTTLSSIDNNGDGTSSNWSKYRPYIPKIPGKPNIPPIPGVLPLFLEGGDAIYGLDIIPNITRQTFDIMNNNNEVILDNIILRAKKLEVGEYSTTFGINYSYVTSSSYDNVAGYKTNMSSVYIGMDRQVHEMVRLGFVGTFGQGDNNFKNNRSSREDTFFQGSGYLDHNSEENVRFISMIFFGKTKTYLDRRYSATLYDRKNKPDYNGNTINEMATSKMDNYYLGIINLVKKRYEVNKYKTPFYYEPRFEFNISYMMQDKIHESTTSPDFDGLSLDSKNSYSMVNSFGIAIGKDFVLNNEKKLNLELSSTLYIELGNPYKELTNSSNFNDHKSITGIIKPVYGEPTGSQNTIKGYDADYLTLDVVLRSHYDISPLFNIYGGLGYAVGDKNKQVEIKGDLGFNYKF